MTEESGQILCTHMPYFCRPGDIYKTPYSTEQMVNISGKPRVPTLQLLRM